MTNKSLVLLAAVLWLAGCSSHGPKAAPNLEPPRCVTGETMVCHGGQASRLDTDKYDPRFCRCERSVQRL